MRIALFHNTPSGGAKRAIFEWTRRLASRHTIDVYTLSTADHAYCDIRPFVQHHQVWEFTPKRLFATPFGRLNQLQRWRDLQELQTCGRQLAHLVNRNAYDVVFAHTCMYTVVPLLLQFVQPPTIYYLHEPFGGSFVRYVHRPDCIRNDWRDRLNRIDPMIKLYLQTLSTLQRKTMRQINCFLANSHFTQEQVKKDFAVQARLCPCGVNVAQFQPRSNQPKEDFVLSVGELTARKGFDFLVESLAKIPPKQRPGLKLACNIIDTQEKAYIEALAARSGVTLQILPKLNAEQLCVEYNKARLCVYAPVLEPFGLVPLEAMACGTAVVGVREGGVQESIMHEVTGLLVERDPCRFAAAVQTLLDQPAVAAEYGRNGRAHVLSQWTWERSVAQLEKQLQAMVNS